MRSSATYRMSKVRISTDSGTRSSRKKGNDSIDLQVTRFERLAEEFGMEIVTVEGFQKDDLSFDTQITKIKALDPDAVQIMSLGKEFGLIVNTMAQQGLNPRSTTSPAAALRGTSELIRVSGAAANGLIYSSRLARVTQATDPRYSSLRGVLLPLARVATRLTRYDARLLRRHPCHRGSAEVGR